MINRCDFYDFFILFLSITKEPIFLLIYIFINIHLIFICSHLLLIFNILYIVVNHYPPQYGRWGCWTHKSILIHYSVITYTSFSDFQAGDLVWARLEGYPWWPSMVCNHPTQNKYTEGKNDKLNVHVQFFDDPVSRGWVKSK